MRKLPLVLAAGALLHLFAPAPGRSAPVLADLDGDGLYDTATVGDWDDDGVRETEDIQAAVDALIDGTLKTIRVTAGVYVAPTQAPPGPALIQLRSRTTLACDPGARLEGLPPPPIGSDTDTATVANANHEGGNSD